MMKMIQKKKMMMIHKSFYFGQVNEKVKEKKSIDYKQ